MKFPTTGTLLSLVALLSATVPVNACRCNIGGSNDGITTEICCAGTFADGDCFASSISEGLSEFAACCGAFGLDSDCDF